MDNEEQPIVNQLEINILMHNLERVVKTRLLGINDCIRLLRNNQNLNVKYKEQLKLYKLARGKTNTVLNKIKLLLDKGEFTFNEFLELKNTFIKMNLPDIKERVEDEYFEY